MPSSAITEIYTLSLHDALPICGFPFFPSGRALIPRRTHESHSLPVGRAAKRDRKSTRLHSSHLGSSYAVFGDHRDLHSFPTRRSSDLRISLLSLRPGANTAQDS